MGTTAPLVLPEDSLVRPRGDSRCYLVRAPDLLMTEDHSAVMAMVRDGALSRDQAREHPDKNVISRALGSHREVEVTVWPRPFVVRPGDRFLLCSDGLYDVLRDEEVLEAVRDLPPHDGCARLVELARERGAPDNVSVVIVALPADDGVAVARPTRTLPAVS